jgi:UDP-N-acetylglucosamine--N-acetylmuramyl-(pentapeptide) pyrophosphoryl-undecaprenol N-acetylglucosamine transferase
MARAPHIVFAGGGSPGTLYPGLAVAAHVVERLPEAIVTFIGSGRSHERHTVAAAGFGYAHLPSRPAPQNALHAVRFVTDNLAGFWASRWYFREKHVSIVVGLGGAASAAAVRAAMSRGIPTIMLEANIVPSRVTRWLATSATAVCVGHSETRADLPASAPVVVTGNPARPGFERIYRQREKWLSGYCDLEEPHDATIFADYGLCGADRHRQPGAYERRLVVIGGAEGARSINEYLPRALGQLREELAGWQVVHQSGEGQLQKTALRYRDEGVDALVVACIDEMALVMFDSDLAVCRPGGMTLAELALAGLPAVLVPNPANEHHLPNTEPPSTAEAAMVIEESKLAGPLSEALVAQLKPLLTNDARRRRMAHNMRSLARPDAAAHVTETICEALCRTRARLAA